jgi:hypothetical protein
MDPFVRGEVGEPDGPAVDGQVGVGGGGDDELLGADDLDGPVPFRRGGADGEVGLPGLHGGDEVLRTPELDQPHLYVGVVLPPAAQRLGQDADADREERADVQFAGVHARRAPGAAGRAVGVGHDNYLANVW